MEKLTKIQNGLLVINPTFVIINTIQLITNITGGKLLLATINFVAVVIGVCFLVVFFKYIRNQSGVPQ